MIVKDWCSSVENVQVFVQEKFNTVKEYSLVFDESECRECSTCVDACPINALEKED